MKVAVTYDENEMIFQHFGHTERFKIYEVEDGKVVSSEVVDTAGAGHEALATFLAKQGLVTLICGRIGPGAVNAPGQSVTKKNAPVHTGAAFGKCGAHTHALRGQDAQKNAQNKKRGAKTLTPIPLRVTILYCISMSK